MLELGAFLMMMAHVDATGAEADAAAVRAVLEDFQSAWNRGDLEALVSTYTDPHVDANAPQPVQTRGQTRKHLRGLLEERRFRIGISSDDVVVAGEWAFQRGEFVLTPLTRGAETVRKRYIEILKRGDDGRWRVFWSMDAPVEGQAQP